MQTKIVPSVLVLVSSIYLVSAMEPVTATGAMVETTMMKKEVMVESKATNKADMMKKDSMMKSTTQVGSISLGSKGEAVATIQKFLIEKGFLTLIEGTKTGNFGPATRKALMKYQESVGITPTGTFGPKTKVMMYESSKTTGDSMMKKEKMMKSEDSMMKKEEVMKKEESMKKGRDTMTAGSYEIFSTDKLMKADKGSVVLFFKASWCPSCRAVDSDIKANLASIPSNLAILEVDYDTSEILKKKYGVTYQHTFVKVDKDGNLLKKWSGSPSLSAIVVQAN